MEAYHFDLFYKIGNGSIDNQQLKKYASQRSNVLMHFLKSRMNRPTALKDATSKEEVTANYDMLVFGKEEEKLKYSLSKCNFNQNSTILSINPTKTL